MMTLEDQFLADILEHPDDDLPRLVYADWLEEHGDEEARARAEFIRVQCELARLKAEPAAATAKLQGRGRELRRHCPPWFRSVEADLGPGVSPLGIRRGFIDGVSASARTLLRHGEHIRRIIPLRCVSLSAFGGLADLVESPILARIEGITLTGCRLSEDDLALLLSSRHLTSLRELDLRHARFLAGRLHSLLRWSGLSRLRHLSLVRATLTEEDIRSLARCQRLSDLTHLCLSGNDLGSAAAEALARSRYLGSLTRLDLSSNRIGDRGAAALVSTARLPRLRSLCLTQNCVGDRGARAIARSTGLGRLAYLSLGCNSLQAAGQAALRATATDTTIFLDS
jgi:uncharacterized protein (TIGR02996 family)